MRSLSTALVLGVSLAALALPAAAQTPSDEAPRTERDEEQRALSGSDIVVTADRREQTIQDYAGTAAAFFQTAKYGSWATGKDTATPRVAVSFRSSATVRPSPCTSIPPHIHRSG